MFHLQRSARPNSTVVVDTVHRLLASHTRYADLVCIVSDMGLGPNGTRNGSRTVVVEEVNVSDVPNGVCIKF